MNPRAGGQAPRQARQKGLNEWDTINNFGEEAVVNKTPALKVKVLPAVVKGDGVKGVTPRRGMGRDRGPTGLRQSPSTAVSAAWGHGSCSLPGQHHSSLGTDAVTTSSLPPHWDRRSSRPPACSHSPSTSLSPCPSPIPPRCPRPVSQPSCHSSSGSPNTTCVFLLSPPHTTSAPGARAPVPAQQMLFQHAATPFPPFLSPSPLGSRQRRGQAEENEWGCLQKAAANSWGMPSPTRRRVTARECCVLRPGLPNLLPQSGGLPIQGIPDSRPSRAASGPRRADVVQHGQASSDQQVPICTAVPPAAKVERGIMVPK